MKVQSAAFAMAFMFGAISSGCSGGSSSGSGGGSTSQTSSASSGGASGGSSSSGGSKNSGGSSTSGGAGASGGNSSGGASGASCASGTACGGDVVGIWEAKSSCLKTSGDADISYLRLNCKNNTAYITGSLTVTGTLTLGTDGKYTENTVTSGSDTWELDASCLLLSGTKVNCDGISGVFAAALSPFGYEEMNCVDAASGGCTCQGKINQKGGMGVLYNDVSTSGRYTASGNTLTVGDTISYSYCVKGSELTVMPKPAGSTPYTGTIVLQKSDGGTGGAGGGGSTGSGGQGGAGGTTVKGGAAGGTTGGASGGTTVKGGTTGASGGTTVKGGTTGSATGGTTGGSTGSGGSTVVGTVGDGPCDIYAAAGMKCVVAYSMVRSLSKSYKGPLFQVRAGSSSTNNTMSGGTTKDIMPGADGFVDSSTVDAACGSGYCTVSVLYDHSGTGNDLKRAPKGSTAGGATGALDDYESIATKGQVTAGGHKVYSLYMNKTEGYRSQTGVPGKSMPTGTQPQGTYELADGTRGGTACCWDFGNVTSNPATEWAFMDTICFGVTYWGKGNGAGPWFALDFEGGVWAGGTKVGDPGWGGLNDAHPVNTNNPSLKVPFALGFIRVKSSEYAIRVADLSTASDLTTAYLGGLPVTMGHKGGIVLGVGGDNSNNSMGTFYEGAIVAGYPTNDIELSVMNNIKAVGYTK